MDLDTLKKLVEWHIGEGSHGLVPVGTTGESPTLTHREHEIVIEEVVKAAAGRVPVIAGAGSNNTLEGIGLI
ncbi:MAG TPA: 4-hydroxy-tetrahydrodipicolinate synthase, partial [Rhodobacteraceae bacterium]|nr:4-hydroxy-tetrahydrodipicolinate synthase [Paracoccaceae bacterium]